MGEGLVHRKTEHQIGEEHGKKAEAQKKIEQAFYRQFVLFDETVHKRPLIYPVAFGGGGGARE
ncbi:protein of unknown function [Vibrio tapetis subsp. tapetis]|uniref:Uncharacterized protein n=1 Tax=Vibrio tapetis subsp. tapetis TaxID=1671868 RepID=A0A2N8ZI50_9VIBR|nr:protein of unknown function [Vibrio tapetis subsp. tapetis]